MNADRIKEVVGMLLTALQLPFDSIEVSDEQDFTRVEIVSSMASKIIGWHGETLNAIQQLAKAIIRTLEHLDTAPFLVLDVDGYRKMQEEKVCSIAQQKAEFVRKTGRRIALAPMSPYFRRIVHLYVANTPLLSDLTTESIGEGDYRQVVLKMKGDQKAEAGEELSPVMAAEEGGFENLDL